jgi:glutamine amidotransferase
MIAIVDYGIGNLASIENIIRHIGGEAKVTCEKEVILSADGVLLPGVGSFDACVTGLRRSGLLPAIEQQAFVSRVPILGICVGMQMMAYSSEEGNEPGLGWFDARVQRLNPGGGLKVPHMGWGSVSAREDSVLFSEDPNKRFYFVHSYHVVCKQDSDVEALACYGAPFTAAIAKDNLYGVQFHPEKSHQHGMRLFENYLGIVAGYKAVKMG